MGSGRGVRGLWDYDARANVWKIVPLEDRRIIGEARDLGNKRVTFFCVSLDDGRVHWQGKGVSQPWWTGIEAVHGGILFLHDYPVPSMPDHGKIVAIDASSGDPIWENPDLAFGFASGGSVFASKELFDRRAYYEIDLLTGGVVREVPAGELPAFRPDHATTWGIDVGNADLVPELHPTVAGAFPAGALLEPGGAMLVGGAEISNWYETVQGAGQARTLREHLFVLDAPTGEILFRDLVCDGLSLPAGATFFRADDRIVYVRNRTTIRSFSLSTAGAT